MRREPGFTLIELMIVIGIIAIIASISIPNILAAKKVANERAAMATLRTVSSAEIQFQSSAKADEDYDGMGEYGGLGELSGAVAVRGSGLRVPTDLSGAFRTVSGDGEVSRAGYYFRLYLPDAAGAGVREVAGGGYAAGALSPDMSETTWCIYSWPANRGWTGVKVFFANERGEIIETTDSPASGANPAAIVGGAAFRTSDPTSITGDPAIGTTGADGSFWRRSN